MSDDIHFQGRLIRPAQIASCVAATPNIADHCQIILGINMLTVRVEATPEAGIEEKKIQAAYRLNRRIEDTTGAVVGVEVCDPGAITHPGEAAFEIIDERTA